MLRTAGRTINLRFRDASVRHTKSMPLAVHLISEILHHRMLKGFSAKWTLLRADESVSVEAVPASVKTVEQSKG